MRQASQSEFEKWRSLKNEDVDWGGETGRILLASEGRPISLAAVAKVANLAMEKGAKVHVLSVARIWGSAFGLPHPGLMPTARELQSQREIVSAAIDALEQRARRRDRRGHAEPKRRKGNRQKGTPADIPGNQ